MNSDKDQKRSDALASDRAVEQLVKRLPKGPEAPEFSWMVVTAVFRRIRGAEADHERADAHRLESGTHLVQDTDPNRAKDEAELTAHCLVERAVPESLITVGDESRPVPRRGKGGIERNEFP